MSTHEWFRGALAVAACACAGCLPQLASAAAPSQPLVFGTPASARQLAGWQLDVLPDGQGLPDGRGDAVQGARLFAADCASCHGAQGQGMAVQGRGAFPRLVGGIGTIASGKPVKTVGSFWPYATGVFDYIRRAMPLNAPESLSADQVYSLTAFILYKNRIIGEHDVIDRKTLPQVKMPNRHGFYQRPQPETANVAAYRLR